MDFGGETGGFFGGDQGEIRVENPFSRVIGADNEGPRPFTEDLVGQLVMNVMDMGFHGTHGNV